MAQETTRGDKAPSITLTDAARDKLKEVVESQNQPIAGLRLQIVGRGPEGFQHVLSLVPEGAEQAEDVPVETDGLTIYLEGRNVPYLDGVKIHYEYKGPNASGLEFENPNPLWFDEKAMAIQDLFDSYINPSIAAHGGWVNLIDVQGDTAYVQLGGGCQGCGMADVTLKHGIEQAVRETVPEIEQVVDVTDHASGTNPYFKPSKK